MKVRLITIALAIALILLVTLPVFAAPSAWRCTGTPRPADCVDIWEVLQRQIVTWRTDIAIAINQLVATVAWLFCKIVVKVVDSLVSSEAIKSFSTYILEAIREGMPGELRRVVGGNGLFYLALVLAGIFMMIPAANQTRIVRAEKVLLWGLIIFTLFISGQLGYDVIEKIEFWRMALASNQGSGQDLLGIVTPVFQATASDIDDEAFDLPEEFKARYFLVEPQLETAPLTIMYFDGGAFYFEQNNWTPETYVSMSRRFAMSLQGTTYAVLSIFFSLVLLQYALVIVMLLVAAVMLILFFVVSLPMNFFEFGSPILMGIVRQYTFVFLLTVFSNQALTMMVGFMVSRAGAGAGAGLTGILERVPAILIGGIVFSVLQKLAWDAMTGSVNVVQSSFNAVSSLATPGLQGGGVINAAMEAGGRVISTAATATVAAGAAALTGGGSLALTAGTGALIGGLQQGAAGDAGKMLAQGIDVASAMHKAGSPPPMSQEAALRERMNDNVFRAARYARSPMDAARGAADAYATYKQQVTPHDVGMTRDQAMSYVGMGEGEFENYTRTQGITPYADRVMQAGRWETLEKYHRSDFDGYKDTKDTIQQGEVAARREAAHAEFRQNATASGAWQGGSAQGGDAAAWSGPAPTQPPDAPIQPSEKTSVWRETPPMSPTAAPTDYAAAPIEYAAAPAPLSSDSPGRLMREYVSDRQAADMLGVTPDQFTYEIDQAKIPEAYHEADTSYYKSADIEMLIGMLRERDAAQPAAELDVESLADALASRSEPAPLAAPGDTGVNDSMADLTNAMEIMREDAAKEAKRREERGS